ncbi:hypothetical protein [Phaeobacter inhibens]|uniref:hypothetical protein n=1 Tax=Phaeobacter inhibens TaxID=221822 RepID=UPI0021A2BBC6|nr:hypothetical protein [Phaeobacter inhibens]UWR59062.1 hypothetical protein K4F88_08850 [Phaeobacter inhibens]
MSKPRFFETITSGESWWSCYYNEVELWFERVVVFSAIQDFRDDERNEIVGIDQANLNDRMNGFSKESKWFRGYVHADEFEVQGKKLKPDSELKMINLEYSRSEGGQ